MASKHKALLIGASDYSDIPGYGDLPFVRDDIQRLREVLTGRGFQADTLENRRGITQNTVRGAVHRFLADARSGDTLLIVLSGHGIHIEGKDYLVPEDAPEAEPFTDGCIEIGWHKEVEKSLCERVVFLIDACREGRVPDTKSVPGTRPWRAPEIIGTLRRKVAYVHACAKPQSALFVRDTDTVRPGFEVGVQQGESFSLFSRAVADVIATDQHALSLRELSGQVQDRVDLYHRAYGKAGQPQQVKVTCESGADGGDFPLLPGAERRTEVHAWVRDVDEFPWHRALEGTTRETIREVCRALAGQLAATYQKATQDAARAAGSDPWHDPVLAERTHERMAFMVGQLAKDVVLSPTEAALAFLFPLVAQTFWAQEAAQRIGVLTTDVSPHRNAPAAPDAAVNNGPDQHSFDKFTQGFPRLKRRLGALEHRKDSGDSVRRIKWWLFHRWLIKQPELYTAERLKALLGEVASRRDQPSWVADALSGERLAGLLREHRTAPFTMRRATAARLDELQVYDNDNDHDVIAATTGDEHEVRTALVAALVKAASAMAVDPVDLPEIVVEHIGVHDSVDPGGLLATVQRSDWRVSGLGRSLNAVCTHPAVQVALREHATRVDVLLRDINRGDLPALAPLRTLPPYADGSRVRLDGNTPDQLSDGIRFQLAEDRVQELLMGEELYGTSDLAVRELYQNALDALRYRDCRTRYLRRTGHTVADWEGRIEFVQGVRSDGRAYLECRDNGIGMGISELSTVFSQGGARFVDLPEYVEEQAAWSQLSDPKPELYPNSRFGIGVLSYFMLADEIVVRTCRMGREGHPGRLLQVTIAGPGNFFRVEDLGPGDGSGTTVQLLLSNRRRSVSCVEALEEVLWVAPYLTTATHGARSRDWLPGELSPESLEIHGPRTYAPNGYMLCVPSDQPDVWWIKGEGVLLADGLLAETDYKDRVYGAVVNLTNRHAPDLTVDRKKVRSFDEKHVQARMTAALPSLIAHGNGLLGPQWLEESSNWSVSFADRVAEEAHRADLAWPLGENITAPFGQVGGFPADTALLPLVTGRYSDHYDRAALASFFLTVPPHVLRWRLRTLYRAGLGGPAALDDADTARWARPSDLRLLSDSRVFVYGWGRAYDGWLRGPLWPLFGDPPSPQLADTGLLSIMGLSDWRDPAVPVRSADTFTLSSRTERSPAETAERLTELGYRVEPMLGCAAASYTDLPLLRPLGNLDGWLSPGATLSAAQIGVSAVTAECSTSWAARRLAELGFTVPAEFPAREQWSEEERSIVAGLWPPYETEPSPEEAERVSRARLNWVARRTDLPLRSVVDFLGELGFALPPNAADLPELTDDDRGLLAEVRRVNQDVNLRAVASAARRLNSPPGFLVERLRELGYGVADLPDDERLPSREDITLLGTGPELDDMRRPLPLVDVAEMADQAAVTLAAAVDRLGALGYRFGFDPAAVSALRDQDVQAVCFGRFPAPEFFGPVSPDAVRAAAHHTGQEPEKITAALTALGYQVAPVSKEWAEERRLEDFLYAIISKPPNAPALLFRERPAMSLTALLLTAMRLGKPLREVAETATTIGIRHEAETWFIRAPEEPSAPSAAVDRLV
ncbi:caspase family protein [Streptomyces sp. NPDC048278]|uniref:wHTH domain-containing protein n=1 Tax=Streptomyces sp. NPDC048278 TaxID=3155809 RepID=UPI003446DCAE